MNQEYNFIVKLTLSCPGNCSCCKNRQKNFEEKKYDNKPFDIHVFEQICKNIVRLRGSYVCLSGGEPTILPEIDEYIKIAKEHNLSVRINTNGWGITEEKLNKWLSYGLDQIVLSVYSLNPNVVKQTRGNLAIYERALNAANILKKARQSNTFMFILQTIIMRDNYKEIPELLHFAIKKSCDRFWPSYLEDAINLPSVRMTEESIIEFRNIVIPKMKTIILENVENQSLCRSLLNDIEKYYKNPYANYHYHGDGEGCPLSGSHFTFYPNGIVDPCPGHEYFASPYQFKINYKNIDEFMTLDTLTKYKNQVYDYCKHCPQGKHQELNLSGKAIHEHACKEEL